MLTGDASATAHRVGGDLAIDAIHAELLPDEKVAHVEALLEEKRQGKVS